ncbi:cytidylyltransferase family-domain-containing protein [Hyaloraphidium curvatum]|nr:cytidylyltransferase family-domain-containing protein [Hyaloraphidium curvatum]
MRRSASNTTLSKAAEKTKEKEKEGEKKAKDGEATPPDAPQPRKERPLPSLRRFSLVGLLNRLIEAIPTGRPPRDEMPDVVLLVAGVLVPVVPTFFAVGDPRAAPALFTYHTLAIISIMFAHVMVVAPKRESVADPRGFFEGKLLELGARVLGYVWIGQGIGGAAGMLRMSKYGGERLVATALTTALGDTFGYFVGRALGRTKVVPGLSPNKTLEGLLGHILLAPSGLVLAVLLQRAAGGWTVAWMPERTKQHWPVLLVFGWIVGAVGASGDLVESFIKRAAGVKDSGDVFRGHGGLLDRLDSHILTFQVSYLMLYILDVF